MSMEGEIGAVIMKIVIGGVILLISSVCNIVLWRQERIRLKLRKQGIGGPSPSFLLGNIPEMKRIQHLQNQDDPQQLLSHDWPPKVFPYFDVWKKSYGPIYTYSTGNIQILYVTDTEMVKKIALCTSSDFGKPASKERAPLLGEGILASSGSLWEHQRKIISPEFYLDKVKCLVELMVDSTTSMLNSWSEKIDKEGGGLGMADVTVDEDLRNLSADIISRAFFGSSYSQGKHIFSKIRTLQQTMGKGSLFIGIPGLSSIPTKSNREIWRLEKEINDMILELVKKKNEGARNDKEKNLLQKIVEGARNCANGGLVLESTLDKFIVDNTKNLYFAGRESTAVTVAWALMLLASHPEWQNRVRAEVIQVCGSRHPDADMLRSMKMLTMVIQETLRLYPPGVFATREARRDLTLGSIRIPKGVTVQILIPMIHHDPTLWGSDASLFNPERFSQGILGASKIAHAFMPFGVGNRICLGQHLAMIELKVILSIILSKFSFKLSPMYKHCPSFSLTMEAKYGVSLRIRRV
ncbi:Cytochrome P450 [Dillenia turbinata]|uniref:Cytochrome P450 n=1 Tax=Dillenia turbinata TaxID=194707 RepID=A0AAN8UIF1_9MAGN